MKIGEKIHWVKSCPSTNDLAKDLASNGADEGTVIFAGEQTKGRGTKGRVWFSPQEKGLYISIILRPEKPDISLIPLLAGLAVRDAVFEEEGIRLQLKWPNDLVWERRKTGGILCESSFLGNRVNFVILGIGLNIGHKSEDFPEEISPSAISLAQITNNNLNRKKLMERLWDTFTYWYDQFSQDNSQEITETFQEHSLFSPGENILISTDLDNVSGRYKGIGIHGELILEVEGIDKSFFAARIITKKNRGGEFCF